MGATGTGRTTSDHAAGELDQRPRPAASTLLTPRVVPTVERLAVQGVEETLGAHALGGAVHRQDR